MTQSLDESLGLALPLSEIGGIACMACFSEYFKGGRDLGECLY